MNTMFVVRLVLAQILLLHRIESILIGQIDQAMLVMDNPAMTVSTDNTVTECLCQAYSSPTAVVAINYFADNGTCQFFTSYKPGFVVRLGLESTLYLIQPLPVRPQICTDLTWLLDTSKFACTDHPFHRCPFL